MRVEDGGDVAFAGYDVAYDRRRVKIVHDRSAFVQLPADVVSATLRSRTHGGEFPRHVVLEFEDSKSSRRRRRVLHFAWAGGVTPGGESAREIGVPHALASSLGIKDGDDARFAFGNELNADLPTAESVSVAPLSSDDWEAVVVQAEAMEATLLSQIGLAAIGQTVPFYGPGGGKPLFLRVQSIAPASAQVARLAANTELIVEPWRASTTMDSDDEDLVGGLDLREWLENFDENKTSTVLRLQHPTGACAKLLDAHRRVVSYERREFEQELEIPRSTAIAVGSATAKEHKIRHGSLVRAFKHSFEREFDFSRTDDDVTSLFLRVIVVDDDKVVAPQHVAICAAAAHALELFQGDLIRIKEVDEDDVNEPTAFTARLRPVLPAFPSETTDDKNAAATSGDDLFTKRRSILAIARALGPVYAVTLGFNAPGADLDSKAHAEFYDESARALFIAWLREQSTLDREDGVDGAVVINSKTRVAVNVPDNDDRANAIFEVELKYPASVRVSNPEKPILVSLKSLLAGPSSKIRVELGEPIRTPRKTSTRNPAPGVTVWPTIPNDDEFAHIPGEALREHTDHVLKNLKTSLWFDAIALRDEYGIGMCAGTLVTGSKGRGRSRLVKSLCKHLATDVKALSGVVEIKCDELPKPHYKALEAMRAGFEAAKSRQPSICYLLNLEKICGADADEEGQSSDSYHLSCIIADAMSEMADADEVTFIATASERDALCKPLREQDVFEYDFEVRKPNMDARKDVILSYAAHRGVDCDEQVADAISQRTDGFDVADLRIIMDRAIESEIDRALSVRANESHRAIGSRIRVSSNELKDALKGYTPIDQLSLAKSDGPDGEGIDEYVDGFDSIGGFDEVKQILEDAIALPARHPKIFSQCPLRLPTGVLLYGPPGSGKSAMAKAAIVNAGLRSITIKGPELFSKYYGESEATLRKLFKRAEDAAPCALFFDEFESLAPRRGGTDGGVTDRMVNQFLTLLDGVESLVGVFVICATSRPDVVDPALLRPGRLDHLLYLPMPDAIARAKIVRTLTREIKVAPGVDLVAIAESERMESFSGADLAAFVSECANVAATRVLKTYTAAVERGEDVAEPNAPPTIEPHDVVEALKRSRASLSQETLLFYKRVHEDFRNSRRASGVGGDAQTFASQ